MKQITQFILEGRSPTLTARAGLQRPYKQILSTQAVYQFCSKNIENISFNLTEGDTLNLLWDKLACRYGETVSGITQPSTQAIYQFCSKNIENISFNLTEGDTLNLLWDKLACRHGEIVSGTRSHHQICPILPNFAQMS